MGKITGPQGQDNKQQWTTPDAPDVSAYREDIADLNLSPEQETALLGALFYIVRSFVDIGFDIGQADVCGQVFGEFNHASTATPDHVESGVSNAMDTHGTTSSKEHTEATNDG